MLCTGLSLIGRRAVEGLSAKVSQQAAEPGTADAAGDANAFCTVGAGQPRKLSPEEHFRIDVELATAFAQACRRGGIRPMSLLTSVGANPASRTCYLRIKDIVENDFRALGFERTSFFRPSRLVTKVLRYGLQDRVTRSASKAWAAPCASMPSAPAAVEKFWSTRTSCVY